MRESEAIELLRTKFDPMGYAVIPQVPNGTGARKSRTADAIMVQLYPSRGITITGVEYKRTVSDFRRELVQPDKADAICQYCHYWVVLAPKGVVPEFEVPDAWGLWEIGKNGTLYRTKPPPLTEAKPVNLDFVAGLLRAAARYHPGKAEIEKAHKEGREVGLAEADRMRDYRTKELEKLREDVERFEKASGISIRYGWRNDALGSSLKRLLENPKEFIGELRALRRRVEVITDALDEIESMEPMGGETQGESGESRVESIR